MLKSRLLPPCLMLVLAACATEKPLRYPPAHPSSPPPAHGGPAAARAAGHPAAASATAPAAPPPQAAAATVSTQPAATAPTASSAAAPAPSQGTPLPLAVAQSSYPLADGSHVPAVQMLLASAQTHANAGELDKAAYNLERAQRLAPQSAVVYQRLADIRLRQQRPAEAEQLLRRALSLAGSPAQEVQILRQLAVAEQRQGEGAAAQDALNRAAALQPVAPGAAGPGY